MTYSKEQARLNLISAIRQIEGALGLAGYEIAVKGRDPREPGKEEKDKAETRLERLFFELFQKQSESVETWLQRMYWDRKAAKVQLDLPPIEFDDEDTARLINELLRAIEGGIKIFGTGNPIIDYTLTNKEAAIWARKYTYELVKGINQTSVDVLRTVIRQFVDTPGMTIGDVMSRLPFDRSRAQRIAVTEITRAYAEGQMMAGLELQKQFPDVRIVKIWFTNNDDRVCPVCMPLDGMEVEIGKQFPGNVDKPPAHVNCRCWIETSTALARV